MKSIEIPAEKDNLSEAVSFVVDFAKELGFSKSELFHFKICTEEIFVNVASYAYYPDKGIITVKADSTAEPVSAVIEFSDSGTPYNPLEKPDPKKNRSLSEAKKGGLGIFITKKLMDDISYKFEDGKNILTIKKVLKPKKSKDSPRENDK